MTVYSSCVLVVHRLCILSVYWGTVTVYSSCGLGVQLLCILAVYWGNSDCVF